MSALDGFRAVTAAAARLLADMLDGPEPCGHDYDVPLAEPVDAPDEWERGWSRGWESAKEAFAAGRIGECPERHYPKWLTDAIDASFDALADLTGVQLIEDLSRAEGMQHSTTAGEVSADTPDAAPSPADLPELPDSELLYLAAAWIQNNSSHTDPYTRTVVLQLRDRAAQFAALEALETP